MLTDLVASTVVGSASFSQVWPALIFVCVVTLFALRAQQKNKRKV